MALAQCAIGARLVLIVEVTCVVVDVTRLSLRSRLCYRATDFLTGVILPALCARAMCHLRSRNFYAAVGSLARGAIAAVRKNWC